MEHLICMHILHVQRQNIRKKEKRIQIICPKSNNLNLKKSNFDLRCYLKSPCFDVHMTVARFEEIHKDKSLNKDLNTKDCMQVTQQYAFYQAIEAKKYEEEPRILR